MLKQRVLTSVILIPLVLLGLFFTSPLIFQLILAGVLLFAAWEWTNLAQLKPLSARIIYLALVAIFFCVANYLNFLIFMALGLLWWFFASYFIMTCHRSDRINLSRVSTILMIGILILTSSFSALSYLQQNNRYWVVLLMSIVWLADITAYFTGQKFGKHLLAPHISPKKTWEGFFGALFFVSLATWVLGIILSIPLVWLICYWVFAALIVGISVVGDLFESYLKRQVGLKDSGQILPGHGGLLDRIDSLVAAAPFFGIGIYLSTLVT